MLFILADFLVGIAHSLHVCTGPAILLVPARPYCLYWPGHTACTGLAILLYQPSHFVYPPSQSPPPPTCAHLAKSKRFFKSFGLWLPPGSFRYWPTVELIYQAKSHWHLHQGSIYWKIPPFRGEGRISARSFWGKKLKLEEKKRENVKENRRQGKDREKRGSKRVK